MPAKSLELRHTIKLIQELDAEIAEIEAEIKSIMDELQSPILTIPGISYRMGAMILAEIGDFSRFDSPDKILAFAGLSPSTYQSGQFASLEVFNDVDGQLINLFRCVKYHCSALQEEIQWALNSRELFLEYKEQQSCRGFTDIQRAAQYFLLIKESYGSDIRSFGCSKRNIVGAAEYLSEVQKRLQRTVIENKDFESLVKTYDRPGALFYLDPPYHGTEKYYSSAFNEEDHKRLNRVLQGIKGKFLLSYNDDGFVRNLYNDFKIEPISRKNNLLLRHEDADKDFNELIITNY